MAYTGFIADHTYRIEGGEPYVYLYGRLKNGKSFCTKHKYEPYFFIKEEDKDRVEEGEEEHSFRIEETDLKSFKGDDVVKVVTDVPGHVRDLRESFFDRDIECYEADIRFSQRFLIDHRINITMEIDGDPEEGDRVDVFFLEPEIEDSEWQPRPGDLDVLSIDIETSTDGDKLYCISLVSNDGMEKVIIAADETFDEHASVDNEMELLERFKEEVISYDPDVIVGWNVIDFDLDYLRDKFGEYDIDFSFGRTDDRISLRVYDDYMRDSKADVPGRVVLDGIHVLKSSFIKLEDYKLSTASKEFLEEEKLLEDDEKGVMIDTYYEEDKEKLIEYNLKDSELVLNILGESGTLALTILRSWLTGMTLDRVKASIASIDSIYLKRLRSKGYVAVTTEYRRGGRSTTGGFVMDPKPGIYQSVIVMDFSSLYPSIMRTFNIDPLTYREDGEDCLEAPNGAMFSREKGLMPEILGELYEERLKAKGRDDDVTSGAIKILMNSVYGVLASPNYRFYNENMANAITSFGHKLIKDTTTLVEEDGYDVIYGDTDSIFIDLDVEKVEASRDIAEELEDKINTYFEEVVEDEYEMESYIEIEYEKTFKKLLMPRTRGSKKGAKKRYAGLIEEDDEEEMTFTGLEFVRRDWTELSKKFQLGLFWRIFKDEEIDEWVRDFVDSLKDGEMDDLLIYRKALRKDVEDYVKTTPQHVKAAKKKDEIRDNVIKYILTINGPEPVENVQSSIDYDHYIEKQIKPIAESVLPLLDKDFDAILRGTKQTDLGSF